MLADKLAAEKKEAQDMMAAAAAGASGYRCTKPTHGEKLKYYCKIHEEVICRCVRVYVCDEIPGYLVNT